LPSWEFHALCAALRVASKFQAAFSAVRLAAAPAIDTYETPTLACTTGLDVVSKVTWAAEAATDGAAAALAFGITLCSCGLFGVSAAFLDASGAVLGVVTAATLVPEPAKARSKTMSKYTV
jgi:hypothetical protein